MNKLKNIICFKIFLFLLFSHVVTAQNDPGVLSTFSYEKLEYDLGDIFYPSQFPIQDSVEIKASVHTPSAPGTYPLVLMLHGRHATCYYPNENMSSFAGYPCNYGTIEIPNYAGYDYIGELLASRGYIMVSISSNGIIGATVPGAGTGENDSSDNEPDGNILARAELIDHHLDLWNTWSTTGGGPFGDAFVGKVDMNNIITIGHSRGGEGVVKHYEYNQTQSPSYNINGVFAIAPTAFNRISDGAVNLGVMIGDCDGDLYNLQGLFYYDDARYQFLSDNGGTYHNFILKGANHNFFNTVWTPGEYSGGGTRDDWALWDEDQSDPYCGTSNSANERLSAEQQRNTLKAYISAFVEKYAGNKDIYDDVLNGIVDAPPSATIDSDILHPSYHPPVSERKDVNRMTENSNTETNTVGGNVTTSGLSFFESCGYDGDVCGQSSYLDNHYRFHAFANSSSSLGRIWVEWTNPGAWYRNTIPVGQSDVSAYSHITLRAAVNSNGNIDLDETTPQNFTLALTDGVGNTDIVEVADYSDALYVGKGEGDWLPRSLNHTIAIPLTVFNNLDLNNIRDLRFIFNKSDSASLLISDIAFTRFTCSQGLACDDGDPCTSGETYDANCNCTGGTQDMNDADNDGICDANDSCPGTDDAIIGTACDDGDVCTTEDVYNNNCECIGILVDIDDDGICDVEDACPNDPDNACVPPEYCDAQGSTQYEFIQSVELNGQSNVSGDNDGYADFTGTTLTTLDNTNTIVLRAGFPGNGNHEKWKVWIDFNKDGDFDDAGEEVFSGNTSIAQPTLTGTFIAAPGIGTTRMRVVMRWHHLPLPSCGNLSLGEVEDYTVELTGIEATCTPGNSCDDGDDCTINDTYNDDCECVGTFADADNDTVCDVKDVCPDFDDRRIGTACDDGNDCTIIDVYMDDCQCVGIFIDTDNDTVCDAEDACFDFDDRLIGTVCNDANDCTINDVYTADCECVGTFIDSDGDGVCNAEDICPNDPLDNCNEEIIYCEAQGTNTGFEFIQSVEIGGLVNESGDNDGYAAFPDVTFPAATYPVSITLTPGFVNSTYDEYWSVWIDANEDGDFDDPDELVFSGISEGNTPLTGRVRMPAVFDGVAALRVAMNYDNAPEPCGSFQYGEVEDYLVSVDNNSDKLATENQLIQVYPNPTKGLINVDLQDIIYTSSIETVTVTVYTIDGKRVHEEKMNATSTITIDTHDLPNASYILRLHTDDGKIFNGKFVKL